MICATRRRHKYRNRLWTDNGASIATIAALLLPVLVGFIGLGLDTANWYSNHRKIETIVESAALAAAPYLSSMTTAQITAVVQNVATLNGLSTGSGDTISVWVNSNPSTLQVTATRNLKLFFSALFLSSGPVTTASAEASSSTNPVCVLVTSQTASGALTVDSGATLAAPNCEIDVASTSSTAATFNGSLPNVTKVCVAGGSSGSGTAHNLTNGCTTATDTYANIPAPTVGSCTVNGANYGPGTVNLNPGVYCGHFNWNGPGTLNLACGTYILNGTDWTISESWTVNAPCVTFYLTNSSAYIDFNQGATVTLKPPTTGTYANILMFEPAGLVSTTNGCTGDGCFNITAQTTGNIVQGVIHLPSRNVYVQAAGLSGTGLTLVVNTVTLYSTMNWTLTPSTNPITNSGNTMGTLLQ
jgi:Flp pilus assembly protein TadG